MDLNKMAKVAYENSFKHGFWDNSVPEEVIPEKLMLIVTELAEAMEEYRNGHMDEWYGDNGKPEGFGPELADTIIRIGDLAHALGLDLNALVAEKHQFNLNRPFRHGGKAC